MERAICHDAGDAPIFAADFPDFGVESDPDAEFIHEPLQSERDVVKSAVHIPEVVTELDRRHGIHKRRCSICRRSDVFDEEVEDVAEVACLQMRRHPLVHRAEQIKLEKFEQAVVLCKTLPVVQTLLEVAVVCQVV